MDHYCTWDTEHQIYVLAPTYNLEHVLQVAPSRPDAAAHPDKRPNADGTTCEQPLVPVRATPPAPVRTATPATAPTAVPFVVTFTIEPSPTPSPTVAPTAVPEAPVLIVEVKPSPTPKPTLEPTATPTDIPEEWIVPQDTPLPPCTAAAPGKACGYK